MMVVGRGIGDRGEEGERYKRLGRNTECMSEVGAVGKGEGEGGVPVSNIGCVNCFSIFFLLHLFFHVEYLYNHGLHCFFFIYMYIRINGFIFLYLCLRER